MLIIKKQTVFNVIFTIALVFAFGLNFIPDAQTYTTAAPVTSGKIIVIDAGHGSPDGGAVSNSGTLEKDLNLKISKRLGSLLQQSGAYVIYTRSDDNSIADDLNAKIRDIKRSDMRNRKDIKNNSGADLFVSIHMNFFEDPQYSGAQVFYKGTCAQSKMLAESIQQYIKDFADNTNTREAKDSKNSIFILNDSNLPSVLVECGFLSNAAEESKLKTADYQDKIAFSIFSGISNYFTNNT